MGPIRPWLRAKRAAEWRDEALLVRDQLTWANIWLGGPHILGWERRQVTQEHLDTCVAALGPEGREFEDPEPFTLTVERWRPES